MCWPCSSYFSWPWSFGTVPESGTDEGGCYILNFDCLRRTVNHTKLTSAANTLNATPSPIPALSGADKPLDSSDIPFSFVEVSGVVVLDTLETLAVLSELCQFSWIRGAKKVIGNFSVVVEKDMLPRHTSAVKFVAEAVSIQA